MTTDRMRGKDNGKKRKAGWRLSGRGETRGKRGTGMKVDDGNDGTAEMNGSGGRRKSEAGCGKVTG
jgi:hypothetical protein